MGLILPEHYDPRLSVRETQEAIKYIRDTFQKEFGKEMNLAVSYTHLTLPTTSRV